MPNGRGLQFPWVLSRGPRELPNDKRAGFLLFEIAMQRHSGKFVGVCGHYWRHFEDEHRASISARHADRDLWPVIYA